jgi:hypothetical protein
MAWHQHENWVTAYHFETWYELASAGQFDGQGYHHIPKPYVRQASCKYLEFGIFAEAGRLLARFSLTQITKLNRHLQ